MGERFKYKFQKLPDHSPIHFLDAKNGICRFENFAEHVAAGTFLRIELGRLCGMNWYSNLRIADNDTDFYLIIYCDNNNPEVKHNVEVHYNMLNNSNGFMHRFWRKIRNYEDTEKKVLSHDDIYFGDSTSVSEILNLKNGWLNYGTLSFEYGIQVEAIYEDSIWTFNFNDKLFNAGAEQVQFERVADPSTVGPLYAHKLLLSFHSTNLETYFTLKWTDEKYRRPLIDLFQICHGVRFNLAGKRYGQILADARRLEMFNVISYCDWCFVETKSWESLKKHRKDWMFFAIEYNLRHFLASMIKSITSLKEYVDEDNVEKMSNESMKMFVAKFLYEKF
ncbi:hypothetical protein CAEBREN_01670 [Caenorhabditis brenneri]|uniref:MATH domain-containing protein n=1 Tax=Caenorhabditis brenneri TaxID=135651 RepID=G0NIT5_CAEBE|nr:hypothetical protein CAEBREN_01670 [Caenorhabditis brenneri]